MNYMIFPGDLGFRILSPVMLFSLLIHLTISVGAIFRQKIKLESIHSQPGFDVRVWIYCSVILYASTVLFVPLIHWPESPKKISYINDWKKFQVTVF